MRMALTCEGAAIVRRSERFLWSGESHEFPLCSRR
jgi:hypothetical protein